jgi:hypothetical protein
MAEERKQEVNRKGIGEGKELHRSSVLRTGADVVIKATGAAESDAGPPPVTAKGESKQPNSSPKEGTRKAAEGTPQPLLKDRDSAVEDYDEKDLASTAVEAVKQYGRALMYASAELKGDREIVMEAASSKTSAIASSTLSQGAGEDGGATNKEPSQQASPSMAVAAATAVATTTVLALVAGLIAALRMKYMSADRHSGSSEVVANTTKADKNGTIKTSFESVKNAPENRKIKTSKKKKKRLEKQRAKQRDSHATSSTSTSTSTGRGSIAFMAIVMICFLAALLAVLTQLGSVSFRSFPWSGILLFLLAEMSSESNQGLFRTSRNTRRARHARANRKALLLVGSLLAASSCLVGNIYRQDVQRGEFRSSNSSAYSVDKKMVRNKSNYSSCCLVCLLVRISAHAMITHLFFCFLLQGPITPSVRHQFDVSGGMFIHKLYEDAIGKCGGFIS